MINFVTLLLLSSYDLCYSQILSLSPPLSFGVVAAAAADFFFVLCDSMYCSLSLVATASKLSSLHYYIYVNECMYL